MKLNIPKDYTLPEDVADGDTFEELVTFRVDGESLVPTMLAGVEIAADMEDEDDDAEDMEMEAEDEAAMAGPMTGMGERIMGMA
jgi:mannose/fructose/N-acetylgalactosamine-specific phosphotransferase system component IID